MVLTTSFSSLLTFSSSFLSTFIPSDLSSVMPQWRKLGLTWEEEVGVGQATQAVVLK